MELPRESFRKRGLMGEGALSRIVFRQRFTVFSSSSSSSSSRTNINDFPPVRVLSQRESGLRVACVCDSVSLHDKPEPELRDYQKAIVSRPCVIFFFQSVNWCFESSQPLGTKSGLKETFIKRYIVERTNRDKTRRTEWENGELSGEFMEWNKVERAIRTETDTRTE